MELIVLSLGGSLAAVLIQLLEFIDERGFTAHGLLLHPFSHDFRYQSAHAQPKGRRHVSGAETRGGTPLAQEVLARAVFSAAVHHSRSSIILSACASRSAKRASTSPPWK